MVDQSRRASSRFSMRNNEGHTRHNVTVTLGQTSTNKTGREIDGFTQPPQKFSTRPGTYVPGIARAKVGNATVRVVASETA